MRNFLQKIVFVFIVLASMNTSISQEKKLDKAKKQYDKYEYIDAQETYLKVVKKGYESADLFMNLGNSYYFNSQFKEASKWYEKLITLYPEEVEPEYYYRYAQTLKSAEKYKEADIFMKKFTALSSSDQRAKLFQKEPDYIERIDFQSGRFTIKNIDINSPFADFGAAFYGEKVVFSSSRDTLITKKSVHQWNAESFLDLYEAVSDSVNGELSDEKKLSNKLNTKFHESSAIFTKDGSTVYFTRNNYNGRTYKTDTEGTNKLKIYRAYKKTEGGWTTPQNLAINDDNFSTAHPALSPDENTLYFSSDKPGGKGQSDIYSVALNSDGTLGEPENLGDRINTEGKDTFPFVDDTNDLYFSSDGHIGLGGLDVFVTSLEPVSKEQFMVINVGKPINGPHDDFGFVINKKVKRGYFSSDRDGGKGNDDIYSFLQTEDLRNFCETKIVGTVTDQDTGNLIAGATVSLLDMDNNLVSSMVTGDDGMYSFEKVACDTDFFIRVEREEYDTMEELIRTPSISQTMERVTILVSNLKSAVAGDDLAKLLSLKIIYFDFDQSYIRKDAGIELEKVIEAMKKFPEMKIDVRSHTDSYGDDAYNLWLSKQRAKSTIKYMVGKKIDKDRLSGDGYGETQLVNKCGNDSNCTKDEYELNRRSEFIIMD